MEIDAVRHATPTSARITAPGRLAQLGEHQLDKLGVTGSSPVAPITATPGNTPYPRVREAPCRGLYSFRSEFGRKSLQPTSCLFRPTVGLARRPSPRSSQS